MMRKPAKAGFLILDLFVTAGKSCKRKHKLAKLQASSHYYSFKGFKLDLSVYVISLLSFVSIFAVHQASRAVSGESADAYPSGMLIAGGLFGFHTSSLLIGLIALASAAAGHYLSVYLCRKNGWHTRKNTND